MGMGASGGGAMQNLPKLKMSTESKLGKALVVEDIKVVEKKIIIEVPELKTVEERQIKYLTDTERQVKYSTREEPTTRYVVKEADTTKYIVKTKETIQFVPKEVHCEKPVLVDKPYERPIIKEKEYTIATIADMDNVRKLMTEIPQILNDLNEIRAKLDGLKGYKLVEEVKKVPLIQWVNTPVERIVWKDVIRERPSADKNR